MKRTQTQNRALHLWFCLKADQCRDAGITAQMALRETIELEMTPDMMKVIWKEVQKALFNKKSTTELNKSDGEFEEISEHLNRFFAEKFNLEGISFPFAPETQEDLKELQTTPDYSEISYPLSDGEPEF